MNKFVRKYYINNILDSLRSTKTVILTGARQVGKTTILKQITESQSHCLYLNCEDFFQQKFFDLKDFIYWLLTEHKFDCTKDGILMLDEIQSREDPDRLIKSYYDNDNYKAKMIVTGSRFRGQKTLGASMVGRGKKIKVFTYSFLEFLNVKGLDIDNFEKINFNMIEKYLNEYLTWGGYPAVVHAEDVYSKKEKLKDILFSWIQKDFPYFLDMKYRPDFLKLIQHIAHQTGNVAKLEQFAQFIGLSRRVIIDMISFLEESFMINQVYPFFTDKNKEYTSLPKIYLHDIGLLHFLTDFFEPVDHDGKLTETYVNSSLQRKYDQGTLYFYKKRNLSEIDFIFQEDNGLLIPIEVKTGNRINIPEIFYRFNEVYGNKVKYYVLTSKSEEQSNIKNDIKCEYIPFWKI